MILLSEFTTFVYADIRCQTSRFKMYRELFRRLLFQVLIQELQDFRLCLDATRMRDVPDFGIKSFVCLLAPPHLVHLSESILYARYREELVLRSIDEEHWLRTGEGGNVGIVEILAKTWDAVGETTILFSAISPRELGIGGNHPANGGSQLDSVAQCREHPRAISPHRTTCTPYSVGIHHRQ